MNQEKAGKSFHVSTIDKKPLEKGKKTVNLLKLVRECQVPSKLWKSEKILEKIGCYLTGYLCDKASYYNILRTYLRFSDMYILKQNKI